MSDEQLDRAAKAAHDAFYVAIRPWTPKVSGVVFLPTAPDWDLQPEELKAAFRAVAAAARGVN